jgi:DNA invertase Pin-like site-specific DNA recombinase
VVALQRVAATLDRMTHSHSFVAYYRVSTDKQGKSGLGLDAQREAVQGYVGERGRMISELVEVESGRRADRPELADALRLCRLHGATLVIAKLDRLSRNVAFVSSLMERRVDFLAVDFPEANRLTIHILAAVAEHEAYLIRSRTKDAMAAAKARGARLGGDRGNLSAVRHLGVQASARSRSAKAAARVADLRPTLLELKRAGLTLQGIAEELNRRGVNAARGGRWGASQVARVLGPAT